jgi:hypothetical protein
VIDEGEALGLLRGQHLADPRGVRGDDDVAEDEDLPLCRSREMFEIPLETWGEPNRKAGRHVSQRAESVAP